MTEQEHEPAEAAEPAVAAAEPADGELALELGRIAELPVAERAAAFGELHERLRAALEDAPEGAGGAA